MLKKTTDGTDHYESYTSELNREELYALPF